LAMLVRARRRPTVSGEATLFNAKAEVISWKGTEGEVRALGERWHARADHPLSAGQAVHIVGREGLTLLVEPR
jgi:membrane-bound serine protease (ClpP class)